MLGRLCCGSKWALNSTEELIVKRGSVSHPLGLAVLPSLPFLPVVLHFGVAFPFQNFAWRLKIRFRLSYMRYGCPLLFFVKIITVASVRIIRVSFPSLIKLNMRLNRVYS